jgi:hypothetical protein
LEFFKPNGEEMEDNTLLQTIRIPKNLLFLTDRLPQANYEKIPNKKNLSFNVNSNLPSINKVPNSKNRPRKEKPEVKDSEREPSELKKSPIQQDNNSSHIRESSANAKKILLMEEDKKKRLAALDRSIEHDIKNPNNIKIIKNIEDLSNSHSEEQRKINNLMLPNIKASGGSSYEIKYEKTPKRK